MQAIFFMLFDNVLLTQALVDAWPFFTSAMTELLKTWQPSNPGKTQLLINEEEKNGEQDDEDAHCGKEADGLGCYYGERQGTRRDQTPPYNMNTR